MTGATGARHGRGCGAGATALSLFAITLLLAGCGSDATDATATNTTATDQDDHTDQDDATDRDTDGEPAGDDPPGDAGSGDTNEADAEAEAEADAEAVAPDGPDEVAGSARDGAYDAPPELAIDPEADYAFRMTTNLGVIEADLYADEATSTVNSFVFLAREGFYDGLVFHRVIPGFVAQGGDPRGDGSGGPGYQFDDELAVAERTGYPLGTLAMANSGPDTNGSQFFFTVEDVDLPPLYAVFGEVTSGLEVLEAIAAKETAPGDRPVDDIVIESVEVEGP